jgi:hypothetical protein
MGSDVLWGETAVGDWQPINHTTKIASNHHLSLTVNRLFFTAYADTTSGYGASRTPSLPGSPVLHYLSG